MMYSLHSRSSQTSRTSAFNRVEYSSDLSGIEWKRQDDTMRDATAHCRDRRIYAEVVDVANGVNLICRICRDPADPKIYLDR